jgi:hypothetical protein
LPPITEANVLSQAKGKAPYYIVGATQKDLSIAHDAVKGWIYTFYAYYKTVFSNGNERWRVVLAAHTHIKQDGSKVAGNMFIPGSNTWGKHKRTDPIFVAGAPTYDATTHPDAWTRGTWQDERYPTYWVVH